jgi:Tfp pilus assembly protein PilF
MDLDATMHDPRAEKSELDITSEQAYRAALQDLAASLAVNPNDPLAHEERARALSELDWETAEGVNPQEIAAAYDAALQLYRSAQNQAEVAKVVLKRGMFLAEWGDDDGALRDIQEYIRLKPTSARGYYARATIYEHQGKKSEAQRDYAQARRLNPKVDDDPVWWNLLPW